MREKPYQIVDVMTGATVEWCTYAEYMTKWAGEPGYDVNYRPGRKKKVKK
jgi:hypothetical protein